MKKKKLPETEELQDTATEEKTQAVSVVSEQKENPEKSEKTKKRFSLDFLKNGLKRKEKEESEPEEYVNVERFNPDALEGLSVEQVNERISQGLINKTTKKYSKTYKSIFIGNICTFFNLLCLICVVLLLLAHADKTQFLFVPIFLCNIAVGIFQEIRAKKKIDKLSILSSPTAKAVRGGSKVDIPVDQLVVDDVILLSAGQQVPADCIVLGGAAELNESLLTGESVPIKKTEKDPVFAGSFIASGQIAVRVDKVGDHTYVSKLTARAKKYVRPNSEIMNSI